MPAGNLLRVDSSAERQLISVIMIFLNERRFIEEAIRSVLAQTHQDWELLLIDDGSTDGSSEIARSIAAKYPAKVRYLEHAGHQNLGMSASRNLGVCQAKGSLVAFIDADDMWVPGKLEEQLAILSSHPTADMVFGAVQYWYSWTGKPDDLKRDCIVCFNAPPNTLVESPKLLLSLIERETVTSTIALIRRSAIINAGCFEESFRGLYEDQAFFAKLCSKSAVFVSNDCWYKWRKHSDASSYKGMNDDDYRAARLKFLVWVENYLSSQGHDERELSKISENADIDLSSMLICKESGIALAIPAGDKKYRGKYCTSILPSALRHWFRARVGGIEYDSRGRVGADLAVSADLNHSVVSGERTVAFPSTVTILKSSCRSSPAHFRTCIGDRRRSLYKDVGIRQDCKKRRASCYRDSGDDDSLRPDVRRKHFIRAF